jgi:hypothetical protein
MHLLNRGEKRFSIFLGTAFFSALALFALSSPPTAPGLVPAPQKKKDKYDRAVDAGLEWLALHQAADGHWSLHEFHKNAREKPLPVGKSFKCDCETGCKIQRDEAATALGLLPFLADRRGNKPDGKKPDYSKTVEAGLKYLLEKQARDGSFHKKDMYVTALAARALCEAYAITKDDKFKQPAQKALDFIVDAQDTIGGGWRYLPRQAGDLSVTGWQLRALKSGQLAGLKVPTDTLKSAERFLDACESNQGNFGYVPGQPATRSMTAIGLLCRQYSGVGPKNPALQMGIRTLKANPPDKAGDLYYLYYANQVLFLVQGDTWRSWNTGLNEEGEKVHTGMRDWILEKQDKGDKVKHQLGSWGGSQGGRMMATSLSLLILQEKNHPIHRAKDADSEK